MDRRDIFISSTQQTFFCFPLCIFRFASPDTSNPLSTPNAPRERELTRSRSCIYSLIVFERSKHELESSRTFHAYSTRVNQSVLISLSPPKRKKNPTPTRAMSTADPDRTKICGMSWSWRCPTCRDWTRRSGKRCRVCPETRLPPSSRLLSRTPSLGIPSARRCRSKRWEFFFLHKREKCKAQIQIETGSFWRRGTTPLTAIHALPHPTLDNKDA